MTPTIADLPADARLIANPNMVLREEDDDAALLFDPDTGAVRILNVTAVAVWKLLDGRRDLGQIIAALREQFDEMDAEAEAQVVQLLNDCHAIGAVGTVTPFRP